MEKNTCSVCRFFIIRDGLDYREKEFCMLKNKTAWSIHPACNDYENKKIDTLKDESGYPIVGSNKISEEDKENMEFAFRYLKLSINKDVVSKINEIIKVICDTDLQLKLIYEKLLLIEEMQKKCNKDTSLLQFQFDKTTQELKRDIFKDLTDGFVNKILENNND